MKISKFNNLIFTILSLTLLVACGKGSETSAADVVKPTDTSSSEGSLTLILTSSASDDSNIALGTAVQLYVSGGIAPYSFSLLSGYGSINSSSGVFNASTTQSGAVSIQVTDGNENTATIALHIKGTAADEIDDSDDSSDDSDDDTTDDSSDTSHSCLERSAPVSLVSNSTEAFADMTLHSALNQQVAVGVGLEFRNNTAIGIFLKTQHLDLEEAKLDHSDAYSFSHGTLNSNRGEIYVQAPTGYYVYGFGAAVESTGENVWIIKIYVARPIVATESFDLMECYVTPTTSGCHAALSPNAAMLVRYKEYKGSPNTPLMGVGLSINDAKVNKLAIKGTRLNWSDCD